ncbi:MAG: tRNA (N(6)-L-threonylcarbamoyladenosine(37)-C(2))-methylthiotransferase MtaB [Leptospiraceae bacterium]|nr:tRNA (N(6)-L-threonylcarbamoyladenosine(37)-C(2))-methylthiotransferase MtaB [Leptospiraceae bacterium]
MKAHLVHFGCRLNQYESDALGAGLGEQGIQMTPSPEEADYIILNTCTVTNRADAKNRSSIRKMHDLNPAARIVVTGCYATTDAAEIATFPGVYKVVDNLNKARIPSLLAPTKQIADRENTEENMVDGQFGYSLRLKEGKKRAYLKLQDGCNKSCSYCKIPSARGPGRSRDFHDSLEEARHLIEAGFTELVLTGVNIGWYQSNGYSFNELLKELLSLSGDFQIRVSSIEPGDVNAGFAEMFKHERMARFAHVPLQSGSKTILKWMRRGYTPAHFRRNIEHLRSVVPDVHIGTDVIVGFPGETEEMFQETLDFCAEMRFANIHVFPYSKRKNTAAVDWLRENSKEGIHEIPGNIIKERISRLIALKTKMALDYVAECVNKKWWAIVEKGNQALTENYLRVRLPDTREPGTRLQVKLLTADGETAFLN